MQIQQNNNLIISNSTKMVNSTTQTNNGSTRFSEKLIEVKSFYNKHFPTDRKTFNWRVPFVGLSLSILFIHFISTSFVFRYYLNQERNYILVYWFIFIAAVVNYELYYGLKIGDRKQFTPWILLKFLELCFIFATIIYRSVDLGSYWKYYWGEIIYGFAILGLNGYTTYIIASMSIRQIRGNVHSNPNSDENIYETYGDA